MRHNRFSAAFAERGNLLGLAAAVALSAALSTPLPGLAGLVAETAYLLFVPDSRWYTRRLSARTDAETARRRRRLTAEILPRLHPDMQALYLRLEDRREQYATPATDSDVTRTLDELLETFLHLAGEDAYLRARLDALICEARGDLPETPTGGYDRTGRVVFTDTRRDMPAPRATVLTRINAALTTLDQQLQLVEDTIGLIIDELRAPSTDDSRAAALFQTVTEIDTDSLLTEVKNRFHI